MAADTAREKGEGRRTLQAQHHVGDREPADANQRRPRRRRMALLGTVEHRRTPGTRISLVHNGHRRSAEHAGAAVPRAQRDQPERTEGRHRARQHQLEAAHEAGRMALLGSGRIPRTATAGRDGCAAGHHTEQLGRNAHRGMAAGRLAAEEIPHAGGEDTTLRQPRLRAGAAARQPAGRPAMEPPARRARPGNEEGGGREGGVPLHITHL